MTTRQPPRPVDAELHAVASSLELVADRNLRFLLAYDNLRKWMDDPNVELGAEADNVILLWDGIWARARWVAQFLASPAKGNLVLARHYRPGFKLSKQARNALDQHLDMMSTQTAHLLRGQLGKATGTSLLVADDLISGMLELIDGLKDLDDDHELKPLYRLINGAVVRAATGHPA